MYSSTDTEDNISQSSQDCSDTEQNWNDNDDKISLLNSNKLFYTGKDKITTWCSESIQTNEKRKDEIMAQQSVLCGAQSCAQGAKTEIECWKLFISHFMLEQMLRHTNSRIKERQLAHKKHESLLRETTIDELLALFGLMYLAGLRRSTKNLNDLWRIDDTAVDVFRTTMSFQRFRFLQTCLTFDDLETRQERERVDNLAPIRIIFEEFVSNCKKSYSPSKYLTIDEKLVAFRGKCAFREHFQHKYGIKLYALVDVEKSYTVNLEIYPGEQAHGLYNQSYRTIDVVDRLVQPISNTNRHVTFDNRFTTIELITKLQQNHELTSTGALRKCEKEIPTNFLSKRGKKINSSQFAFKNNMTLVSYMSEKSKVTLVVSSLYRDKRVDRTSDGKQIPQIIKFYNATKVGVDMVSKLCRTYDVSRASKRWPMAIFYEVMNIAALNSEIIYRENNSLELSRHDFLTKLGMLMLEDHLRLRKMKDTLPRQLRQRIHDHIGETVKHPPKTKKYTRCKVCPSNKDKKTRYHCNNCNKPICLEHVIPVCQNCVDLCN